VLALNTGSRLFPCGIVLRKSQSHNESLVNVVNESLVNPKNIARPSLLAKMLSGLNAFEISHIQARKNCRCTNRTIRM
jgi:hypothetical protein